MLGRGDEGAAVAGLQSQLEALRFWIGPVNGSYGWLTEQAVYAFQKANGITVDGRVGPETRAALGDPTAPSARSEQGRVVEIDKARQLIYAVLDGQVQWVFHTSTGTEQPYAHPDGFTATADTPPGSHTVYYQVDGWQDGRLGPMYRPKYFHYDGIAIHGYHAIPPYPASHGCARVSFDAIDFIWANDLMPMGATVLVYGEAPAPGDAV
ncbi:MAG: L,D-transpeptidase family protein [Acidimicrobiales bacterium]